MNKSFDKIKEYFIPVLSIAVVVILFPLLIMPQLNKIAQASKVINANKNRLTAIENKAKALEKQSEDKANINQKLGVAESVLPITKDVARLVLGVQQLAISSGLKVTALKIQPGKTATSSATPATIGNTKTTPSETAAQPTTVQPKTAQTSLDFEIGLSGSFPVFEGFLKSLESAKRILTLSSFKSVPSTTGSGFNFDVFITAPYGQLPELSSDQIAQELPVLTAQNQKLLDALQSESFKDINSTQLQPGPTGVPNPFVP